MPPDKPPEIKSSLRDELSEFSSDVRLQINDLDAEIAGLQKKRNRLVNLLQNALGLLETEKSAASSKAAGTLPGLQIKASGQVGDWNPSEMPFRDIIRSILKAEDRPMRPVEVADVFKKAKIPYEHKTDLATRIANELYRMRKTGELTKTGKRYHYPKDE